MNKTYQAQVRADRRQAARDRREDPSISLDNQRVLEMFRTTPKETPLDKKKKKTLVRGKLPLTAKLHYQFLVDRSQRIYNLSERLPYRFNVLEVAFQLWADILEELDPALDRIDVNVGSPQVWNVIRYQVHLASQTAEQSPIDWCEYSAQHTRIWGEHSEGAPKEAVLAMNPVLPVSQEQEFRASLYTELKDAVQEFYPSLNK